VWLGRVSLVPWITCRVTHPQRGWGKVTLVDLFVKEGECVQLEMGVVSYTVPMRSNGVVGLQASRSKRAEVL
jgi:hypothetical protein